MWVVLSQPQPPMFALHDMRGLPPVSVTVIVNVPALLEVAEALVPPDPDPAPLMRVVTFPSPPALTRIVAALGQVTGRLTLAVLLTGAGLATTFFGAGAGAAAVVFLGGFGADAVVLRAVGFFFAGAALVGADVGDGDGVRVGVGVAVTVIVGVGTEDGATVVVTRTVGAAAVAVPDPVRDHAAAVPTAPRTIAAEMPAAQRRPVREGASSAPTVAATRAPDRPAWPRTLVSSANTLNDWVER